MELDQRHRNRSQIIQGEMWKDYELTKVAKGLAEVEQDDTEEKANNAFFAMMHPELKQPISDVLRDKGMTLQKFKRNMLGEVNRKRPVAQNFNSNMVKALHRMVPPLKTAIGHELMDPVTPKTPLSTIRTQRSDKRSTSMGLTMSSFHKTQTVPSFFI